MKATMCKTTIILIFMGLSGWQISAQPDIGQFFNNLKNKVIPNADKLVDWKRDAENTARKKNTDFTDCPSPEAQNLYDDLKRKLEQARETERLANEADSDAQKAREDCKKYLVGKSADCDAAFNPISLNFKAIAKAAKVTAQSLEATIKNLKERKCAAGCAKNAQLMYPTIQSGATPLNVQNLAVLPAAGGNLPIPYLTEISYCTSWGRGSFWANWNAGNGEFSGDFELKSPKCEKVEKVGGCSEWNFSQLLPELQKLKIVPPEITASDLKVEVPNRDVNVVSSIKKVYCANPIKVPKRLSANISVELSSDPIQVIPQQGQEMVEIGCAEPNFGIEPVTSKVAVPDLTKARISWNGIKVKAGYIEVDLSGREFRSFCKKGFPTSLRVPTITIGKGYLDLPYACLQPRMIDLVATK